MVLGGIFGAFGIILVYIGAKGTSHIKLFGQSVETTDIGVASIFLGAVTVVIIIRRLLKSADKLTELPGTLWIGDPGIDPKTTEATGTMRIVEALLFHSEIS